MYANIALPQRHQLVELFEMLFGRHITIKKAPPRKLTPDEDFWAAVYLNARPRIAGVMILDNELAVRASAALSLFPAHQADRFVKEGMDEALRENFDEVCNVATCLFQDDFATSVTLARVFHVPDQRPKPLFKLFRAHGHRKDVTVEIKGYGKGSATLLVA